MSENNAYSVRKCRGHFHVQCGGEDLILLGDPYATREAAERMANLLNKDLTVDEAESEWEQGDD